MRALGRKILFFAKVKVDTRSNTQVACEMNLGVTSKCHDAMLEIRSFFASEERSLQFKKMLTAILKVIEKKSFVSLPLTN